MNDIAALIWEEYMGAQGPRTLIVDDSHERIKMLQRFLPQTSTADNPQDGATALLQAPWDVVFLDHDFDGQSNMDPDDPLSGTTLAKWIAGRPEQIKVTKFVCHSNIPDNRDRMVQILQQAGYDAVDAGWMQGSFIQIVQQVKQAQT